MKNVIVICNQKGGVGKTTTAVNLAACLAAAEQRTLLIDIDPQGNATSGLGIDKATVEKTVYDVLTSQCQATDAIQSTSFSHLSIMASNSDLVGADLELSSQFSRESILLKSLINIKNSYEFIVIDCPPSLGLVTINAMVAADWVIVPVQCEYYAMEGMADLMETIRLVQENLKPDLQIMGVLLTMFDGRNNLSHQVVSDIREHLKDQAFGTVIPRNVKLSEAPSHGLPIILYDIKSIGAARYLEFTQEVMQRQQLANTAEEGDQIHATTQGLGQGLGGADSPAAAADHADDRAE